MALLRTLITLAVGLLALPASASHFPYSSLGVDAGKRSLENSFIFVDDMYRDLNVARFYGSYAFHSRIAARLTSASASNKKTRSELSRTDTTLGVLLPMPLGQRLDLVPELGFARNTEELCQADDCRTSRNEGLLYALGMRLWAIPKRLEVHGRVHDSSASGVRPSAEAGLGWWLQEQHSFRADYGYNRDFYTLTLGYRFSWR